MMPSKKNPKIRRSPGKRRHQKLFLIATEGEKTEPQYFDIFNDQQSVINVRCLKGCGGSPQKVLERMKDHLEEEELEGSDEAWLVIDKDNWLPEQLAPLHTWTQERHKRHKRGLALSNPKFEYWLLLHFEDGKASSQDCSDRLKKHIPGYDKKIDPSDFTRYRIDDAIRRAKQRDNPPCADWPRTAHVTTVYRLVESILQVKN